MSEYHGGRASPRRRRGLIGGAVAALALAAAVALVYLNSGPEETPPVLLGAPLRLAAADGDALFVLTTHQRHLVVSARGNTRRTRAVRYLDLWRFDAATARPVWRRRLRTEREGRAAPAARGARLLGAQGGTLWVQAGGPLAVAAADGRPIGDADTIAARSPALRDAMPTEARYVVLADDGLRITATDASVHRVDPATLVAQRVAAVPGAAPPVVRPGAWTPQSAVAFATRGLDIPGRWLGVLSAEEGERFRGRVAAVTAGLAGDRRERAYHDARLLAPPDDDGLQVPTRVRLWGARVDRVSAAPPDWPANFPDRWGTRAAYADVAPLPESPDFLQGGLLHAGGARGAPLLVRGPDGVLVLHRDRLGVDGRLQLTRVAGPGGRPVWDARLPLSIVQSVLPGPPDRRTIVLVGREYATYDRAARAPDGAEHEQIVGVDVATGAVRAYDLTAQGPAEPVRP
ncbi:PA2928 family protein [Roseisolibacter sp. H3M3-2]|uniref:PA2928 family protein n=1 Tax=Roseisolibacter sp. H3M3-2 TaxID=3031323 RepID=UPI0023DBE624|nr:PA2928 family protein [Roseisolibacter sp. H3M3-2]MDF1501584.1 PA2928 family protein [Roseisolibacter sp. H3M3-2]